MGVKELSGDHKQKLKDGRERKAIYDAIHEQEELLKQWDWNVWYTVQVAPKVVKSCLDLWDPEGSVYPNWWKRLDLEQTWYYIRSRAHDDQALKAMGKQKGIFTEAEARAILWRENHRIRKLTGIPLVNYLRELPDYGYIFTGNLYFVEVDVIVEELDGRTQ